MQEKLDKIIDELSQQMIQDLKGLLQIDSTYQTPKVNAPYGQGVRAAFDYMDNLCLRDGLEVVDVDGHMLYGNWPNGADYIGIFGHLDVVETGKGWLNPPFSGHIANNRFYSRGALDNKGPMIAAYYGLLALMKSGFKPKRSIRIIFGGNEESGMADIKYYLAHENPPILGFTPDNKFPAIYGERGRLVIKCQGEINFALKFINDYLINNNLSIERLGINFSDSDFGMLQLRNQRLEYDDKDLKIYLTLSYPNVDSQLILNKIKEKALNLNCQIVSDLKPVLNNPNATLVKVLNTAFNQHQKMNLKPTTTTGATYAHICRNIIPFGPSFPGQNGIAHLPNEWFSINDLVECAKIYAYALYKLALIDEIEIPLD